MQSIRLCIVIVSMVASTGGLIFSAKYDGTDLKTFITRYLNVVSNLYWSGVRTYGPKNDRMIKLRWNRATSIGKIHNNWKNIPDTEESNAIGELCHVDDVHRNMMASMELNGMRAKNSLPQNTISLINPWATADGSV